MSSDLDKARALARTAESGGNMVFVPPPIPQPHSRVCRPRMTKNQLDRPLPSPLRPHVLAGDRFLTWMTPHGLNNMDEQLETFSPGIIACRRIIMSHAVLPKTLGNYAAGLIWFIKFCDDLHISEQNRMPASELLLATFVTTRGAGTVAKGAMDQWILGLELWHHINNAPW